ncbi:GNAT family N-acetyltransferase [Candidatus Halobonum tyrrellensis]|uniref:N-acetyltransferase GCN5 n=1 Tax=Candidatus Halobonum tyrrellensis G22 TaxID=1324957 RepID=V4HM88_9EURY|nr:GNAT family N-acetyltransferase [Candidatus Halobonum tyrrellensis]ESP89044.1 N-acetyltransferase GCN5 [Candidatus Halobonum tyrrellensis G22]
METVELDPTDAAELTALYAEYGWWADRDAGAVAAALSNTDLALGVRDGGTLVAAARVLTDFAYYARVYDVVVAADRRGEGLGRALLSALADDERLRGVNLALLCREGLVPFYESAGFEPYPETVGLPEGGEEPLVRMVRPREGLRDDEGGDASADDETRVEGGGGGGDNGESRDDEA